MGHGDEIVLADANFPAAAMAHGSPGGLIHCDGTDIPTLLRDILTLLPLDPTVPPCALMAMMPEHVAAGWQTPIWATYKKVRDVMYYSARRPPRTSPPSAHERALFSGGTF